MSTDIMATPYQCIDVQASSGILFAARGANIYSFSLKDGSHISPWKYPKESLSSQNDDKQGDKGEKGEEPAMEPAVKTQEETSTPPAKRRRLDEDAQGEDKNQDVKEDVKEDRKEAVQQPSSTSKKTGKANKPKPFNIHDLPMVSILASTKDEKHLVAVTSHDKLIWVLEHDGKGNLKHQSQRAMPKRPCSISISPDDTTILSADKFGDIYSLPLIHDMTETKPQLPASSESQPSPPPPQEPEAQAAKPPPAEAPSSKPAASTLTVHTGRNLQALEHQLAQKASNTNPSKPNPRDASILAFPHALLLGHVSMLTAVTTITVPLAGNGIDGTTPPQKSYILTADRDEHIRVSRFPPQAHIIETFCLGHTDFVSCLCIPPRQPDLLISGGGDAFLLLWDWKKGELLLKHEFLSHVKKVVPEVKKLAVSRIVASSLQSTVEDHDSRRFGQVVKVAVICERVPALFIFEVCTYPHSHSAFYLLDSISLEGNPLDIRFLDQPYHSEVAVSLEPEGSSLENPIKVIRFVHNEWGKEKESIIIENVAKDESTQLAVPAAKLRELLYTTEHLRKQEKSAEDS